MRKGFVVGAMLAVLLSSCGGSEETASTAPSSPASQGDSSNATPPSTAATQVGGGDLSLVPEGATDILGNPAGQGFVVVGGTRYDFILSQVCQKLFGGVQAGGRDAATGEVDVNAIIPPEDWATYTDGRWDAPSVEVTFDDAFWVAQAGTETFVGTEWVELGPEQSSVTSFTNDGSLARGEAVFYDTYAAEGEVAEGSFEFYCP